MLKFSFVFLLIASQSLVFSQIKVEGNWYLSQKGFPAEINNYNKDSLTHGYENIDHVLGFSKQFILTKNKTTYKTPEDELMCTEQLLFDDYRVQNMAECMGIEDQSYTLNGGKHGIYKWINKKHIALSYIVGFGRFTCVYRVKEKKGHLSFKMKENVEFEKLED